MGQAHEFLAELWHPLSAGAVQLWHKGTKKTYTFDVLPAAAEWAEKAAEADDVYMAAGLAVRTQRPSRRRAAANEVVGIPGLWADIDVIGGPDSKTDAAPTREAALELACALIEPTLIVNSGYGVQAWWLFDGGPWYFNYEAEREQAARLSAGFQAALRAKARGAGFGLDSTHDLARLMRLPGTRNHKGAQGVAVEHVDHEGARHTIEALTGVAEEYIGTATAEALQTLSGASVQIEVGTGGAPPFERIEELMETIPEFVPVWKAQRTGKRAGWSLSHFDLSIASYCAQAGFTDQEIADTLIYFRRKHGDAKGKAERPDYLQRTIAKARSSNDYEEAEAEQDFMREQAVEQLARVAASNGDGPGPAATISLFSEVCGGPEIKELVQTGRDPDLARFHIVLADGREVPLGRPRALISQDQFRERFMVVTGHLPPKVKSAKWDKVVRALLNAAQVREGVEDTRAAQVLGWLDAYLDRRVSTDRDQACQVLDPFERDELVHVALGSMNQWLRKQRGERISDPDLKLMLEAAGFERRTVNYAREDGRKSSRSYYVAPKEVLERG